jgi:hypothetical protein
MNRVHTRVVPSKRFFYLLLCGVLLFLLQGITIARTTSEGPSDGPTDLPPMTTPAETTPPVVVADTTELTSADAPQPLPMATPTPGYIDPIHPVEPVEPIEEEPAEGEVALPQAPAPPTAPPCERTIIANVAALDQVYTYNRFGAFNPAGMMYALQRDVVGIGTNNVRLRDGKRPRPIVLRVNEGDCLQVNFINLLKANRPNDNSTFTREASVHVDGLDYVNGPNTDDGANVGKNQSSLAAPAGGTRTYKWYAAKQGQYMMYSMGAAVGGEGDGGQLDLGLFGAVNVEPRGSSWYRSQVTAKELIRATTGYNPNGTPKINYEATHPLTNKPILNILQGNEIIYSDLNAIITDFTEDCTEAPPSSTCGQSFREFTVLFHDEIKAVQAFEELDLEVFHGVRDGFGVNYGASGLGAILLANRKKVGPARNCNECKYEEFFLESHANGDPALIVRRDVNGNAIEALFPDDPSNVHHSYLGDPVRFRNIHVGPKETHVFHLHAHQWLQSPRDQNSTYLDSQTISPGASFTYEINYGGSGNRNFTAGDSIFHCHLYPHFAQGMWELWRNHDVFENGLEDRNLPDGEIANGTPTPAIVPIPDKPMPPMPDGHFPGYPHYIPGDAGHRPPQPPLDFEWDGGLPRNKVLQANVIDGLPAVDPALLNDPVASRVASTSQTPFLFFFARKLKSAQLELLPQNGTPDEIIAMNFHEGADDGHGNVGVPFVTQYGWPAKGYQSYTSDGTPGLFLVNGQPRKAGAPYAEPCAPDTPIRPYRAAYIQFDMTVNRAGWHDRQARITTLEQDAIPTLNGTRKPEPLFFRANSGDCVTFAATNLIPGVLNLDDFQIFTPTDIIGQHIHLVKFDVTSSDGAGNGWNYEDGTFSPDEVRERIAANNKYQQQNGGNQFLTALPHPVFGGGNNNKWVGAQTTIQRWWADPLINRAGVDRTIRTVFTHDHFGPSSHQHHGLYGALVVEPKNSVWRTLNNQTMGTRPDGGPTSFAANIYPSSASPEEKRRYHREFNLAFADFAIVYTPDLKPVNPPGFMEAPLPIAIEQPQRPMPESISAGDPGTQLINYRNEPIPHRIANDNGYGGFTQKTGPAGDMANVFSSAVHGDPFTPLLYAFENERVNVRLIQGAQEEQHVFNIHGVKWLFEPSVANSGYRNGQQIGISEHFEFEIKPTPPSNFNQFGSRSKDRLYSSAATDNLWDGQWGIMRIFQGKRAYVVDQITSQTMQLDKLADAPVSETEQMETVEQGGSTTTTTEGGTAQQPSPANVCPTGAPLRTYNVSAWLSRDLVPNGKLVYSKRFNIYDPNGIVFIDDTYETAFSNGSLRLEPLILRASAGDCIQVTLTNKLPNIIPEIDSWNIMPAIINHFNFNQVKTSNRVGLHPQLVEYDLNTSDGARVGFNKDSTVGPGQTITYTWYAGERIVNKFGQIVGVPIEFGATGLRDIGDVIKHASHGAGGMLIIEPKDVQWKSDFSYNNGFRGASNTSASIFDPESRRDVILFREHVVMYQDDLSVLQNGVPLKNIGGEDDAEDSGFKAFNYRSEPLWARLGLPITDVPDGLNDVNQKDLFSSTQANPGCGGPCGDPETFVFQTVAGTPTRFRIAQPAGHPRQHGFTLFGHHWTFEPWTANSSKQGTNQFSFEVGSISGIGPTRHDNILTRAGGLFSRPGDYMYRTQETFQITNGLWGIFRVRPSVP